MSGHFIATTEMKVEQQASHSGPFLETVNISAPDYFSFEVTGQIIQILFYVMAQWALTLAAKPYDLAPSPGPK